MNCVASYKVIFVEVETILGKVKVNIKTVQSEGFLKKRNIILQLAILSNGVKKFDFPNWHRKYTL